MKSKRSILFLIHSLCDGGAERVTADLANALESDGYEIRVVTLTDKLANEYVLNPSVLRIELGVAKRSAGFTDAVINNIRRFIVVRLCIKRENPDIVISISLIPNILSLVCTISLKTKNIITERSYPPLEEYNKFWFFLRRIFYKKASLAIVLAEESAEWLRTNTNVGPIRIIRNRIKWPLNEMEPFVEPGIFCSNNRKILLAAGRLTRQKGFDRLINTFAAVSEDLQDWDLRILGEGPERESLQQQILSLNLDDRAILVGRVGNITQWYDIADLFVLSSRFEGFSGVLLEAMASGCAVVSVDCSTGPRDIIDHGCTGWLTGNTENELKEGMREVMINCGLRKRLSSNSPVVLDRYNEKKILAEWNDVLENM